MFTLRATARWMCGILVLHAAAAAAVGQATAGGWLVRVFELDGPAAGVPELAVGQLPNLVRVTETLDLDTQRAGDFGPVHENILTMAEGVLTPPAAGRYTLRLTSDDGSLLWLDGRLVIDNDGLHGALPKDADVELSAAGQRIKVAHYQGGGDGVLRLEWKPAAAPAERFVMVPAAALGHDPNAVGQTAPGKKRMIPPLRKGRPGDGRPVTACHPGLRESNDAAAGASGLECLPGGFARYRGATVWVPGLTEFSAGLAENEAIVGSEGELKRLMLDPCDEATQGCVFRCSALPRGAVVRGPGAAFEMRAVHMLKNGIEIEFTEPLDARVGWDPEAYHIEQWPFDVASKQPPQRDGVVYPAGFASVSEDRTRVFVEVPGLKPGHVVYVRLLPPCLSDEGELPWATEAWYTLHTIPNDRMGTVRPAPAKAAENVLTAAEQAEGWKLLFDGRTSAGWRGWKKAEFPDGWQIRDGCLTRVGPGGDICTNEEFGDFELKIDWRIAPAGNSGIFFRASEEFDWCWRTAPEMQVLDNAEHADGRNPLTSAGSNYALQAPVRDVTQPVGLWNEARIVVRGPQVEYWLNGVQMVKYELGSPEWEKLVAASKFKEMPQYGRTKTGHIVLQDHGDRVWFRNIKIRKL